MHTNIAPTWPYVVACAALRHAATSPNFYKDVILPSVLTKI